MDPIAVLTELPPELVLPILWQYPKHCSPVTLLCWLIGASNNGKTAIDWGFFKLAKNVIYQSAWYSDNKLIFGRQLYNKDYNFVKDGDEIFQVVLEHCERIGSLKVDHSDSINMKTLKKLLKASEKVEMGFETFVKLPYELQLHTAPKIIVLHVSQPSKFTMSLKAENARKQIVLNSGRQMKYLKNTEIEYTTVGRLTASEVVKSTLNSHNVNQKVTIVKSKKSGIRLALEILEKNAVNIRMLDLDWMSVQDEIFDFFKLLAISKNIPIIFGEFMLNYHKLNAQSLPFDHRFYLKGIVDVSKTLTENPPVRFTKLEMTHLEGNIFSRYYSQSCQNCEELHLVDVISPLKDCFVFNHMAKLQVCTLEAADLTDALIPKGVASLTTVILKDCRSDNDTFMESLCSATILKLEISSCNLNIPRLTPGLKVLSITNDQLTTFLNTDKAHLLVNSLSYLEALSISALRYEWTQLDFEKASKVHLVRIHDITKACLGFRGKMNQMCLKRNIIVDYL